MHQNERHTRGINAHLDVKIDFIIHVAIYTTLSRKVLGVNSFQVCCELQ